MFKIAVLLATYNGREYISEQVDSILNQVRVDVTIFVSDDLSTDGTKKILEKVSVTNSNVIILEDVGKFGGASKNFYRLIKDVDFSDFDYISLADQDDIWYVDKLINSINCIKEQNVDGYSADVLAFWEDGKELILKKANAQARYDHIFEPAGPGCTYVLSQKLAMEVKFFVVDKWHEVNKIDFHDWVIYAFARENGYGWYIDKKISMRYRQHNSNQLGANNGIKALTKRFKLVFSSWYRNETIKIIKVLNLELKYKFSLYILEKSYLYNILLSKYAFNFRRNKKEKIILFILILIGIY
ncbi:glycosyltransferase [Francisella sp. SYW-9]|uniref:glycosyltransferase n=1 Tax=Francisella sp. SYW-9 TaxID=2610888 RepID=UPI00123D3EA5|nr:glycosyltransferase [Francisella sp. SYW-9]